MKYLILLFLLALSSCSGWFPDRDLHTTEVNLEKILLTKSKIQIRKEHGFFEQGFFAERHQSTETYMFIWVDESGYLKEKTFWRQDLVLVVNWSTNKDLVSLSERALKESK